MAVKLSAEERIAKLEALLGFELTDKKLALCALTHKSYTNEHKEDGAADNERLEFLGDAVIDLAISHRLMERFPTASEGELSRLRALIVNEEGLARVARTLGIGELLLLGRGEEMTGGRGKGSVLGDALEALIGATYLSFGMERVLQLVDRHFATALEGVADGKIGLDYKTRLQEEAQTALKVSPRYKVVGESGPDHEKKFEVEVTVGANVSARAAGRSKKEAEQLAARDALAQLRALASGA